RALVPWPKTYTFWQRATGEPLRLILEKVRVEPADATLAATGVSPVPSTDTPGTIVEAAGERLVVATGAGRLAIEQVQPAGKRIMTAGELLRGYGLRAGDRLGG